MFGILQEFFLIFNINFTFVSEIFYEKKFIFFKLAGVVLFKLI